MSHEGREPMPTGMTLADISIRNHVFAWMLMIGLILFGAIGFSRLGVSQNPDVDFPFVNIEFTYEGASPEVMESDVVDLVEDAITAVEGVREISSTCREGSASVTVEFDLGRDIDVAVQEVQSRLGYAQRRLPREMDPPIVTKNNPENHPIMWLNLSGDRAPREMADYVRNVLKDQFQTLPGVGELMLGGYLERNIRIWLDAVKMESLGITASDAVAALKRQHIEVPAGRVETADREFNVRAEGEAINVEQFREIVIATRNQAQIKLRDIAVVEDGLEDRRRSARVDGWPAIGFGIKKVRGSNAVEVGKRVKAKVAEVNKRLPKGLRVSIGFDSTEFVQQAANEVEFVLVMAVLLTGVVCWLFLGSWSSTVNVLLAIPTSIIGTFLCIYFFGFTLNTFTLLGLSLAVGIVVDDAIMVLENIYRHRERGEGKITAASVGAREITFAAMAATAAIVAIFLPVAFMKGITGRFFYEFGVTISVAVLLSLLEALTLTPMRCSQFLQTGERSGRFGAALDRLFRALARGYARLLEPCLNHRGWVMGGGAVLFAASLAVVPLLGWEMAPTQDTGRMLAFLRTPVGSSLDFTDRKLWQCEQWAMAQPEFQRYFAAAGGFMSGDVNSAIFFITLKPKAQRGSTEEVCARARAAWANIPGLEVVLQNWTPQPMSTGRGFPIELSIRGPDWATLTASAEKLMTAMKDSGVITDVDTDYRVGMPEIKVIPDRPKAADLGVSMEEIGNTVNTMIGGVRVGRFKDGGHRYDVRMRLLADERRRADDINPLLVRTAGGQLVHLRDCVRIIEKPTLQIVTRKNRQRAVGITANNSPAISQADALKAVEQMADKILPDGYRLVLTGGSQTFKESFDSLLVAMVLGIIIAYMVLASQFNSFLHPFTILLISLPFSVTGALIALWVMGQTLNIYSLLGLILLMGIAKKNGILLVDFTNQLRERGRPRDAAIREACPIRLRPILMTSVTTIVAAIPAAISLGPGAETRKPMAIAVIGGMLLSTFLTLLVIPAAYAMLDDFVNWMRRRKPQPVPSTTEQAVEPEAAVADR